jgi:hypothetical protein
LQRDPGIAIPVDVAQTAFREFGIVGFDPGKFVDDSVLIHKCAINNLAGLDCLAVSLIVLCENHASRAALRRIRQPLPGKHRSCWSQTGIRVERSAAVHPQ